MSDINKSAPNFKDIASFDLKVCGDLEILGSLVIDDLPIKFSKITLTFDMEYTESIIKNLPTLQLQALKEYVMELKYLIEKIQINKC